MSHTPLWMHWPFVLAACQGRGCRAGVGRHCKLNPCNVELVLCICPRWSPPAVAVELANTSGSFFCILLQMSQYTLSCLSFLLLVLVLFCFSTISAFIVTLLSSVAAKSVNRQGATCWATLNGRVLLEQQKAVMIPRYLAAVLPWSRQRISRKRGTRKIHES